MEVSKFFNVKNLLVSKTFKFKKKKVMNAMPVKNAAEIITFINYIL